MTTLSTKHFDTLAYVKKAKDLATKRDLKITKNQIIIWVSGLLVASGLIQHFFK